MANFVDLFAQAQAFHLAGRGRDAEPLYRQILAADPTNVGILCLFGTICHELGNLDEAIASLKEAVRLRPDYAAAHNCLGIVWAKEGKLDEALASFQEACRLAPASVEMANNLRTAQASKETSRGMMAAAQGNLDEAAACYRRAIEVQPSHAAAHGNLGDVLRLRGQPDESAVCYRRVLELDPRSAESHLRLGLIAKEHARLEEAEAHLRRAIDLKPDVAEVHRELGAVLTKQEKFAEAAACHRRALELKPDNAEALYHLGRVLVHQDKLEEALICYRKALQLQPDHVQAQGSLGNLLRYQGKLEEALACYRRALELSPDYAEVYYNLGLALVDDNRLEEAVAAYRQALELNPQYVDAHFSHALALLTMSRFDEGWPEYEWRWKRHGAQEEVLPRPRWTGEKLDGRTILVRSEQGFGDNLQFIRFVDLLKRQGATVIVECLPQLVRLLATCPGVDRVIAVGEPLPPFDFHVPLLSVPGILRISPTDIPARIPYLAPDAQLVEAWKNELARERNFKIGIAWFGNRNYPSDRQRSIPLAQFGGIARLPGVRLYSLQMGANREQLSDLAGQWPISDLGDRLGDFHNTAAIMRNLDLVITCDSAPGHLAGAIGVPVWLALAFAPDWRWSLERNDSPWYPTMRLFRQSRRGDWQGVFEVIEQELVKII